MATRLSKEKIMVQKDSKLHLGINKKTAMKNVIFVVDPNLKIWNIQQAKNLFERIIMQSSKVTHRINIKAFELLEQYPEGLHWSELRSKIEESDPSFSSENGQRMRLEASGEIP